MAKKANNQTEDKCAREMLRPWLIGIAILIVATIILAFCYSDDICQAQKNRRALKQNGPNERRASGSGSAANLRGQLAAFVPPWHNKQTPDAITGATPVAASFSEAIGIVSPSIVGIKTTGVSQQSGSGIIAHPMGYILTNQHVVKGAKNIVVTVTVDQLVKMYSAEVIEIKPEIDLAMIRLLKTGGRKFTPAPLGNSNRMLVGQQVVAIGSPFGLSQSASAGIVSNTDRTLTAGNKVFKGLIQTDASINPGSSGGALVNRNAEVIGINTAIYSPTMSFSGIGFAVPVNQAQMAFKPFIKTTQSPLTNKANTQPVRRNLNSRVDAAIGGVNVKMVAGTGQKAQGKPCWLGVDIYPIDSIVAREFNVPFHGGVLVNRVFSHSPAGLAELQRGDVLFRIDGRRIKNQDMLWSYLSAKKTGERIELTLFRAGQKKTAIAILEPEPANIHTLLSKAPSGRPATELARIDEISWLAVDIWPIDPKTAPQYGLDPTIAGVFVGEVEGIAAIEAGLQTGDVITRVNGMQIKDIEAFKDIIKTVDPSNGVVLDIMRQNRPFYVTIHPAKRDLGAWQ
ncbi:trypsin-like peptidase domain-containing protein [Planctomycetota bacterium]